MKHQQLTGSPVAAHVLQDWDKLVSDFIKVYPKDYRRVLEEANQIKKEQLIPKTATDSLKISANK